MREGRKEWQNWEEEESTGPDFLHCSLSNRLGTEGRSNPDSKQKQKQGFNQTHSMCDICDSHKMSQFWICDPGHTLDFFLCFFSQTDLVTFWSEMSQAQMFTNSNVIGTICFCFCFD